MQIGGVFVHCLMPNLEDVSLIKFRFIVIERHSISQHYKAALYKKFEMAALGRLPVRSLSGARSGGLSGWHMRKRGLAPRTLEAKKVSVQKKVPAGFDRHVRGVLNALTPVHPKMTSALPCVAVSTYR